MDSDNKTLIVMTLCLIAGAITLLGIAVGAIRLNEWTKDNQARRCAEYGYECKENQSRNDTSINAS